MDSISNSPLHIFLVSFPGQGHINPFLRLANLLASQGHVVTFSINSSNGAMMRGLPSNSTPLAVGAGSVRFQFYDDGMAPGELRPIEDFCACLERSGRRALPGMLAGHREAGQPVSCLVGDHYLPWVADVASSLGVSFAALWTQSCASFSAHYHFHRRLAPFPTADAPEADVVLPCMPVMRHDEIPTYLHPATRLASLDSAVVGDTTFMDNVVCIFMDTCEELEPQIVSHVSTLCRIKLVGPLCALQMTVCGGDPMDPANDCITWLNEKEAATVVYISMGSIVGLGQKQREELAYGLLKSGLPFLWAVRPDMEEDERDLVLPPGLEENGKVVRWAPQRNVLAHKAVACFVTHCGWNSTMEAIIFGKPVVAFPYWGDQVTNAKFLVDVFEVGVRMSRGCATTKLVSRDDVQSCLVEATVGPKAEELRQNAAKWKKAVAEKAKSAERNIEEFVEEVTKSIAKFEMSSSSSG